MAKITKVVCDRCGREKNCRVISTDPVDPELTITATIYSLTHLCVPKVITLDLCDSCNEELKTFLGWPLKLDI